MKRVLVFILIVFISSPALSNPAKLTTEEYRAAEEELLLGCSGSGGYFLDLDEMAWLKKGRAIHPIKENRSDKNNLHAILGDSLQHMARYKEAAREFRLAGRTLAAAEVDWLVRNPDLHGGGMPKLHFIPGRLPIEELATAETVTANDRTFVSEFKGSVFLDDVEHDRHAVIFVFESSYDWVSSLKFDGKTLTGEIHTTGGHFEYDPDSNLVTIH